jgi:hypothetical protein
MTNKTLRPNSAILADLVVVTDPETGELILKGTGEVISNNMLSQEKEWRLLLHLRIMIWDFLQ